MPASPAIGYEMSATRRKGDDGTLAAALASIAARASVSGDLMIWEAGPEVAGTAAKSSRLRVPWLSRGTDRARLESMARQQDAIAEVGRRFLRGPGANLERSLDDCVELVARTLDVEACAVLELLPKDGRFIVRASSGLAREVRRSTLTDTPQSLAGRAMRANGPLVAGPRTRGSGGVPATDGSPVEEETVLRLALRGCLQVLVGSPDGRQTFGVLAAYTERAERAFTRDDVFFMQFIADAVGGVLERAQHEAAMRAEEARYRRIVAYTPGMVYQLQLQPDGAFSFPFVTEGCRDLFGLEPQDIYDDPMRIMGALYEEDRATLFPAIRASAQSLTPLAWTGRYFSRAGETRWMRADSRPQQQLNGDVIWDGIMFDVSELKRAQQAIASAKVEAEKANRAKSEFLSRISHELRTPLNAILGFSQFMQRQQALQGVHDDCLSHISKAGSHLLGLINEVLDISRIESGHVQLATAPVFVGPMISEAFALLRAEADERGITLELERPVHARRLRVLADPQRFKQVLVNLLSNAVKYNRNGGGVRVSCLRILEEGRDARSVEIAISDDGGGIPPEKLDRVFVAFDRLGAESTSVPGTGLGLALSKCLVEALGGTITVESEPGSGATFRMRLPCDDPRPARLAARRAGSVDLVPREGSTPAREDHLRPSPIFLHPHRVLYIEDNESNRLLLERLLRGFGNLTLRTASTGTEGLAILRDEPLPDLIMLDLHLPDVSGEEILRELRRSNNEAMRRMPIVVMSADVTAASVERLTAMGAHAYLTKPIDLSTLLETLYTHMEARAGEAARQESE